jgi:hypothetical protein
MESVAVPTPLSGLVTVRVEPVVEPPVILAMVTDAVSSVVETKVTVPTLTNSGVEVVTVAPEAKGPPVMVIKLVRPACSADGEMMTAGFTTVTAAVPAVSRTTALLPSGLVRVTLVVAPASALVDTSKMTAPELLETTTTEKAELLLAAVTPEELKLVPVIVISVLVLVGATK